MSNYQTQRAKETRAIRAASPSEPAGSDDQSQHYNQAQRYPAACTNKDGLDLYPWEEGDKEPPLHARAAFICYQCTGTLDIAERLGIEQPAQYTSVQADPISNSASADQSQPASPWILPSAVVIGPCPLFMMTRNRPTLCDLPNGHLDLGLTTKALQEMKAGGTPIKLNMHWDCYSWRSVREAHAPGSPPYPAETIRDLGRRLHDVARLIKKVYREQGPNSTPRPIGGDSYGLLCAVDLAMLTGPFPPERRIFESTKAAFRIPAANRLKSTPPLSEFIQAEGKQVVDGSMLVVETERLHSALVTALGRRVPYTLTVHPVRVLRGLVGRPVSAGPLPLFMEGDGIEPITTPVSSSEPKESRNRANKDG
jgi:hypothetical protein